MMLVLADELLKLKSVPLVVISGVRFVTVLTSSSFVRLVTVVKSSNFQSVK